MVFRKQIITYDPQYPIRLACFSDTQFGSRYFARQHFTKWLKEQSAQPQTFFIGIGDNIEAITTRDKRFTLEHLDPLYLQKWPDKLDSLVDLQIDDFCSTVAQYVQPEQWLGIGRGNHDDTIRINHGSDPQARIAERLGTVDLGYSFLLRLVFRPDTGGGGRGRSLVIYGHHGWGGGSRTPGGDITKFERLLVDYKADIFLTGHTHKPFAMPVPQVGVNEAGKMEDRTRWLCNTGSFMKLLSDGSVPSWAETRGFRLVKLGGLVFELRPKWDAWIDIQAVS